MTMLDLKDFLASLASIKQFPDRSAKWLLENTENLRGLLEIIASDIEEGQLMQSMAEHYLQQGIEQGETRTKREDILKLLQFRFRNVPEPLAEKIRALDNRHQLEVLFEKAATSQTLEELHTEIDTPATDANHYENAE